MPKRFMKITVAVANLATLAAVVGAAVKWR
jgi:hypothetical protein